MAATINRTRRSSLERRCISKSTKRLFKGMSKTMFKVMYGAEACSVSSGPGCRKVTGASSFLTSGKSWLS